MIDLISTVTVAGLSVLSARYLEQAAWFQRLQPETKRLIAVAIAALIALTLHTIQLFFTETSDVKAAFSTALAIVLQQVYHALTKEDTE